MIYLNVAPSHIPFVFPLKTQTTAKLWLIFGRKQKKRVHKECIYFQLINCFPERYKCYKPPNLRDRSLMSLDIKTDLICGEAPSPIPWPAIGAPLSLVVIFVIILSILFIHQHRSGKKLCGCCKKENPSKKKVVSTYTKYDAESDIEIEVRGFLMI